MHVLIEKLSCYIYITCIIASCGINFECKLFQTCRPFKIPTNIFITEIFFYLIGKSERFSKTTIYLK